MKALLIREMLPEEQSLVLSDWKRDLWDQRPAWGRALTSEEWWALINHVVDRISLPSVTVWMACHREEEKTPLAWAAVRLDRFLHMHATAPVQKDPELAACLERELLAHGHGTPADFNPFLEMKRVQR